MADANVSSIELFFFDEATSVAITENPFYLENGGFNLGAIERDIVYNSVGNYSPFFSGGFTYKEREVEIRFRIKDFTHSEVTRLYKNLEKFNNLSRFVEHPLCALYFRLGGKSLSVEKGGYLKVLSAELQSTDDLFTFEHDYHQAKLGQPTILTLKCEPYIYEKNFIKNEWIEMTVGVSDSGAYVYDTTPVINQGNSYKPNFVIRASDIRGDVPSPIGFSFTNTFNDSVRLSRIYMGTNYGIAYPDWIGTGTSPSSVDWKAAFAHNQANSFADGDALDYRFSGKCMVFLREMNTPVSNDLITISIKFADLTVVDAVSYYYSSLTQPEIIFVGSVTVPYPGRTNNARYYVDISSSDNTDWEAIIIPAWNFRSYIPIGYSLPYNHTLYDNPMENTLYTSYGGAYYNKTGEGIYAVPGVTLRGMVVGAGDTIGSNIWTEAINFKAFYNPRYLYVRNILA